MKRRRSRNLPMMPRDAIRPRFVDKRAAPVNDQLPVAVIEER